MGEGSDAREHDLSTVSVSCEDGWYVECRCLVETPRIVRKEDDGFPTATDDAIDVSRLPSPESDSSERQSFATDFKSRSSVLQHLNVLCRQRRRHVAIIVMVAKDGEHTVWRVQWGEELGDRTNVRAIAPRDIVATQDDDVGSRCQNAIDGVLYISRRDHRAVMDVRHQANPQPIERGSEAGYRQGRFRCSEVMALVRDAIRAGSGQRTNGGCDDALECSAPGQVHTRLYSSG